MPKTSPKLNWCNIQLSKDMNWWVVETSDPIHWDTEGLSIIDPRQASHILDQLEPLRDYGLQNDIVDAAFFPFAIESQLPEKRLKLVRVTDSILESEEPLFWLSDSLDEEKSPYADFLDHISKVRVKMLNAVFDFDQRLTVDDLEDEIREDHHNAFLEGRTIHAFREISDILEYVPEGYELDDTSDEVEKAEVEEEEIPEIGDEFPDAEEDDSILQDETMKWDEEEPKEEEEDENYIPPLQPDAGDEELFSKPEEGEDDSPRKGKKGASKKVEKTAKKAEKAPARPAKKAPAKKGKGK